MNWLRSKLVDDWHIVLTRAWSVRLSLIAGACAGINVTLQMLGEIVPSPTLSIITGFFACGSIVAQMIPQKNMGDK